MSRKIERNLSRPAHRGNDPVSQYLKALEDEYPAAKGTTSVVVRPGNRVIVSVPLPKRVKERMRLFDRMAEVGNELLLQTDKYIVLSGR